MTFELIAGGLSTSVDKSRFADLRRQCLNVLIAGDRQEKYERALCDAADARRERHDDIERIYQMSPTMAAQIHGGRRS